MKSFEVIDRTPEVADVKKEYIENALYEIFAKYMGN